MTHPTPQPTPPHRQVITAALDDWWITTDPTKPVIPDAADTVELYLISSGYHITTQTGPIHHTTCDASLVTGPSATGPCILRHHHDGPVHQDASGTTWWTHPSAPGPSRAGLAFTAFLVLACLTGTLAALVRGDWGWTFVGGTGTCLLAHELAGDLTDRRNNHPRSQT